MTGSVKQVSKTSEVDERAAALMTNASAIGALASAVEGTLGPKGLDCMLVDKFGDVTITNDGATILEKIDTTHPAARMLIRTAAAQEEEVGDGTTTTAILASAIVTEGAAQVARGVPVTKVIEGVQAAAAAASDFIGSHARKIEALSSDLLARVAVIAARGHEDIASLVTEAARKVGEAELRNPGFRLADTVIAKEGAGNEVLAGIILDKQRVSRQMPLEVDDAKALIVDDALEPPRIEDDALATESGFARHIAQQDEFRENIRKVIDLGVKFVAVAKGIDPAAEELFTDAGILCVRRLSSRDVSKLVELTGARTIKRSGLKKEAEELASFLGWCERVYEDERLDHIRVIAEMGKKMATVLVGASTREVKDERERIARDAAGAVQSAAVTGVVPGGGAIEIAAARQLRQVRDGVKGMAAYGVDAVIAALKRPLSQIAANAGLNPLEKVEDVITAQSAKDSDSLAVDCDTGEIADMMALGVVDPAGVKLYALRAASEIAVAVLRINTIIRKREEGAGQALPQRQAAQQIEHGEQYAS